MFSDFFLNYNSKVFPEMRVWFISAIFVFFCFSLASSKLKFAVSNFEPVIVCEEGTVGTSGDGFSGMEIDLMDEIFELMGYGTNDYEYHCVSFSEIFTIQADPDITGSIGGITVTYERMQEGIKFSEPTMFGGISLLKYQSIESWTFLEVLGYQIPIIIVVTAFLLSIFFYIFEQKSQPYEDFFWHMMSSIFFVNVLNLQRFSTRVTMVAFWFMILIVISTYTAYMTTIQVVDKIANNIQTVNDINQMLIGTYSTYHTYLYPYGAKPISLENSDGTYNDNFGRTEVLDYLKNGTLNGWALDDFQAKIIEWQECEIYLVARFFVAFNYAIAFSSYTDDKLVESFDAVIETMTTEKSTLIRLQEYLMNHQDIYERCEKPIIQPADRLSYSETYGLFLILIGSYITSIIYWLIHYLGPYKKLQAWLRQKHLLSPLPNNQDIGDQLIVSNLRKVTNTLMGNLKENIEGRLQEMEEKVTKFYDILLQEETHEEDTVSPKKRSSDENTGQNAGESMTGGEVINKNVMGLINAGNQFANNNPLASPSNDEKKAFLDH
jgi:Ligand-gated ion channel/Bacterial extracellular solute-binding proteins, family 3